MKTIFFAKTTLIFAFYALLGGNASWANKSVRGNGKLQTISRTVRSFNKLVVKSTYLNVEVFCSQMPLVEITTDANLLPYLTTNVADRTLTLDNQKGYYLVPTRCLIRVSTEFLNQLETHRETMSVKVTDIDTHTFDLTTHEGNLTKIQLEGQTEIFNLKNAGAGVDARKLMAKAVKIEAQTDQNVVVLATETLEITMTGEGKFTCLGNPKILKSRLEDSQKTQIVADEKLKKALEKTPIIRVKLLNNSDEERSFYVTGHNPYIGKTYGYGFNIKAAGSKQEDLPAGSKIYQKNGWGKKLLTITKEMNNQNVAL